MLCCGRWIMTLPPSITRLIERFNTATPRERASIAVLCAVMALVAATSAFDWSTRAESDARDANALRRDVERVYARDSDERFQQRLGEETNKVWRWSIVASSDGLARTEGTERLNMIASEAVLSNVVVSALDVEPFQGAIGALPLRLSADFDWSTFNALLGALAEAETSFAINAVEVTSNSEGAQTLELSFVAPYLREAPE